jgi:type II secretory pathway pseudopilin PulG
MMPAGGQVRMRESRREAEGGYSLVALVASVTIMLILMGAATPAWRYVMQNDREEELLYRGGEIADAILRFQKKNGNAYPTSLDQLVKGRFLRKLYKDPMTKDGRWRLVHQGQPGAVGGALPGLGPGGTSPQRVDPRGGLSTTTTTTLPAQPSTSAPGGGPSLGPILGVASTSKEKSLRVFNGRTQYNEWIFAAGQPRVIGKAPTLGPGSATAPGGRAPRPTPLPRPRTSP